MNIQSYAQQSLNPQYVASQNPAMPISNLAQQFSQNGKAADDFSYALHVDGSDGARSCKIPPNCKSTIAYDLETVKAINQSKTDLLQRDYTNNINILQGYNNVTQSINNQTYALSSQIEQLGYKMDQCCCGLQRQMLEDKNNDLQNIVNQQSTQIAINAAVQAALGQTGRYVAWEPSGSSTTTKVVAGGAAA